MEDLIVGSVVKGEVTGIVPNQIISESVDNLVENGILLNTTTIKHA